MIARLSLRHILLLALIVRIAMLAVPGIAHPDEIFQYIEPAHRALFGDGIVTWEWRYGMRSWLIPTLVMPIMALGHAIAPQGSLYLLLPNAVMAASWLVVVAAGWHLGARISRAHAIAAASALALCPDFVFYSTHILSETLAITLALPAALLLVQRDRWTGWRLFGAGVLIAFALALRFQYAPALGTLMLLTAGRDLRISWRPLLLGGLLGLVPVIAIDMWHGQWPLQWLTANLHQTFVSNKAAQFGTSGPLGYLGEVWPHWSLWIVPLTVAAVFGARRYPVLGWTALANIAFHSAIAHKEYRFILLSMVIAVLLAALGTVDRVAQVRDRAGDQAGKQAARFLLVCWLGAFLGLAIGGARHQWTYLAPSVRLFDSLRHEPGLCGLALYRVDPFDTPGYSHLHRSVPINAYMIRELRGRADPLPGDMAQFNMVMTAAPTARFLPAAFREEACSGQGAARICLYRRPGTCAARDDAYFGLQKVLARFDR